MYYPIPQMKIIISDPNTNIEKKINKAIDKIIKLEDFSRILKISDPKIVTINNNDNMLVMIQYLVRRYIEDDNDILEDMHSGLDFGLNTTDLSLDEILTT